MRRVYVGAALTSLQPLVLSAVMLPATMFVVRHMGPAGYGQWATATALVAVTLFVTNLGLRATFVRAVARDPGAAGPVLAEQLGLRILLSMLGGAVPIVLCLIAGHSRVILACTAISAVGLIFTTIATTAGDFLQGVQRLGVVASANIASGLLLQAVAVTVAWSGYGPIGLSVAYLVGPLVSLLVMLEVIRRQHFAVSVSFNGRRFRELFWEARFLGGAQLVHSASTNAEALLLPRLVGETAFGYFSGGTLLVTRLSAIPDGLASALYPAVVEADKQGPHAVRRLTTRFVVLGFAACLAISAVVYFSAGLISSLLFKSGSDVATQVMQMTTWLLPVMAVLWVLGAALNGLGGDRAQARAAVLAALVNLSMTIVLVWRYGVLGASWSMLLRYFVWLVIFVPCALPTFRPVLGAPPRGAPGRNDDKAGSGGGETNGI